MSTVTIDTVLRAMEKNGLRQARETYIEYCPDDNLTPIAACAIGMAAINLDNPTFSPKKTTNWTDLDNALGGFLIQPNGPVDKTSLGDLIINLNDYREMTFKGIADYIRKYYPDILDKTINF